MSIKKLDLIICLSCGVIIGGFLFFSTDPAILAEHFFSLSPGWLAAALGCMIAYWVLEGGILHILLKRSDARRRFRETFRVSMGGQYFNAVTPFSTGGQPFQAYYLAKQGTDVGVAAGALLGKFLVYQIALVFVSSVLLLARISYFRARVPDFFAVVLIGYLVNLVVLLVLVGVGFFRGVADRLCRFFLRLGKRLRLVRREDAMDRAEAALTRFHGEFREMLRNPGALAAGFGLSLVQLTLYLAVPWCLYRAFGLSQVDPLTVLGAQGFVMMIASFVPLPGAGVGAEGAFYFFFRTFFPAEGQLSVAMILWRLITFYLTVAAGAPFALRAGHTSSQKTKEREP